MTRNCPLTHNAILQKGSKGEDVEKLQKMLNVLGYVGEDGKALEPDKKFGNHTLNAVTNYKKDRGLQDNTPQTRGKVGPTTWAYLTHDSDLAVLNSMRNVPDQDRREEQKRIESKFQSDLERLGKKKASNTPSNDNRNNTPSTSEGTGKADGTKVKANNTNEKFDKVVYKTQEEALKHMETITVKVWKYDEVKKVKYSSTISLTVNEKVVDDVKSIFDQIYNDPEQFPIKSATTGGYNWRGNGSTSQHNVGLAIDINWVIII